jgi:hypothetical protein
MTRERRQRLKIFCFGILPVAVLAVDAWIYVSMQGWTYGLPTDGAGVFWPGVVGLGLLWFPFAAACFGVDLFHYLSTRERKRWPVTEGRVTAARIEEMNVWRHRSIIPSGVEFMPIVNYAYEVAGITHSTDISATALESREAAEHVLRRHPVGATLRVYYDPDDPGASVLDRIDEPTYQGLKGALACAAAPFVIVTLVIIFG